MNTEMILENLKYTLPICLIAWAAFIIGQIWDMRRFRNSFILLLAIFLTLPVVASLFGNYMSVALCWMIIGIAVVLFAVPVLLVINGIHMIRREGLCVANLLSLFFGILIACGEVAVVYSVLNVPQGGAWRWIMGFGGTIFYDCVIFLSFMLYTRMIQHIPHTRDFDYVITLGCGLLDGERMSKILSSRCDKAIQVYFKDETRPKMICSGGQGPDEKISEARAMAQYMKEHGVAEEDIIEEDKSMDTKENLVNSEKIIQSFEGRKRTAIVTSNYHVYRALHYCKTLNIGKCTGIGARVAGYFWPSALIREFAALVLEKKHLIEILIGWVIFVGWWMFV